MARQNYIYVDYENVQETDLDRLTGKPAHVTLVLGQRNKSLPVTLVKLIQRHADQVNLIETGLIAKNALDFVLACEVGKQTERDPKGYFHILSKDKGFDAVIHHLKSNKILACRQESFSEIPVLMTNKERVEFLKRRYREEVISKPSKRKTLETSIQAAFARALSEKELEDTIDALLQAKVIQFDDNNKVSYPA